MDEALGERDRWLTINGQEPPSDDADWDWDWRLNWLPVLMYSGNFLFVDCDSVTPRGTVPLRLWEKVPEDVFTPVAPSFTHAVATWAAVSIPIGPGRDGLRVGLQLIGPRWSDATLLEAASAADLILSGAPR